ncbi:DNA polymerase III subunit gamma/tau, partial [Candidatus Sumerlaeota bacterium]|nr:DNA polymerase III subunit gamma/tau [Candidatus Sumerlaeota bacterium]
MPEKASTPPPTRAVSYQGLARKWRPQKFAELVGQEAVAQALMNGLREGRVAHGHIMAGPRAVGKTTTARILARALNCAEGPAPEPCGSCVHCREIAAGRDLDVIEIDAASNTGVDAMRELIERVVLAPFSARYKVYIIDEVHMLSVAAFNALLKTLEEPPPNVVFIFATTELEKIPETVRSRCVIHNFRRLSAEDIIRRLGEVTRGEGLELGAETEREIFALIAQAADGGMRDALVALDQILAMTGGRPDVEAAQKLLGLSSHETLAQCAHWLAEGDAKALVALVDDLVSRGRNLERFIKALMAYVHDLMLLQAGAEPQQVALSGEALEKARRLALDLSQATVFNILNQLFELEEKMKHSTQLRFLVEFTFLRLSAIKPLVPLEEVMNRLRALPENPGNPGRAAGQTQGAGAAGPSSPQTGPGTVAEEQRLGSAPAHASAVEYSRPEAPPRGAAVLSDSGGEGGGPRGDVAQVSEAHGPESAPAPRPPVDPESQPLAGLARDELLNLLVPQLPESYRYLGRYLGGSVAMRADASALWIQWPKDDHAGSRMIARPENKSALERTLTQLAGKSMTIRTSFSTSIEAAQGPANAAASPPVQAPMTRGVFEDSGTSGATGASESSTAIDAEDRSENTLDRRSPREGDSDPPPARSEERDAPPGSASPDEASEASPPPAVPATHAGLKRALQTDSELSRAAFMVLDFFGGT